MASMAIRQVINITHSPSHVKSSLSASTNSRAPTLLSTKTDTFQSLALADLSSRVKIVPACKTSSSSTSTIVDNEDGVSLGTMKLPSDIDIARFETLLFQWGNSLSQGATLPLPMPLKVDKIPGGARVGFIEIGDGETEVNVYIDCLVFPATDNSVPLFRAVRNGRLKDKSPPGEPRIMRSLMEALKKCVQIARL